jgi:pimeloyl-ACP methyl ester carboxylesterase
MSFSFAKLADPNKKEKSDMSKLAASVAVATALLSGNAVAQQAKPTIVLVHGAFADSSSWNGVITNLQKDAYTTVAVANPLRGVLNDARTVSEVVASIAGSVVLVGHSYAG